MNKLTLISAILISCSIPLSAFADTDLPKCKCAKGSIQYATGPEDCSLERYCVEGVEAGTCQESAKIISTTTEDGDEIKTLIPLIGNWGPWREVCGPSTTRD